MVKHTQAIRWLLLRNCLTVLDHFVRVSLKGLKWMTHFLLIMLMLMPTNCFSVFDHFWGLALYRLRIGKRCQKKFLSCIFAHVSIDGWQFPNLITLILEFRSCFKCFGWFLEIIFWLSIVLMTGPERYMWEGVSGTVFR